MNFKQKFKKTRNEYTYDPKTCKLVVTGQIDIKEYVNSFSECSLDRVLEKFLNTGEIPNYSSPFIRKRHLDPVEVASHLGEVDSLLTSKGYNVADLSYNDKISIIDNYYQDIIKNIKVDPSLINTTIEEVPNEETSKN